MKKHEMVTLLRSAGVDENAVTLAINAWEMGAECERAECLVLCEQLDNKFGDAANALMVANQIEAKK